MVFCSFFFKILFIYFRQRGRKGETEGEKHQCVVASLVTLTGDLARNPGMCLDWESNQRPFSSPAGTQSTELYQPGLCASYCLLRSLEGEFFPPFFPSLLPSTFIEHSLNAKSRVGHWGHNREKTDTDGGTHCVDWYSGTFQLMDVVSIYAIQYGSHQFHGALEHSRPL